MRRTRSPRPPSSSSSSPMRKKMSSPKKDEEQVEMEEPEDEETTELVYKQEPPKNVAEQETGAITSFKLLLLALMVLQNSSTVLVGRYTRSSVVSEQLFVVNHFVLVAEISKFLLSCILEFYVTRGGLFTSIKVNILDQPLDALKIAVPALLYLVQNTLLYVALSNLSAPLFQVTYQAKLVTTAIVSVIMLNRKYSVKQWICLVILSFGVAIVVLGEKNNHSENKEEIKTDDEGLPIMPVQSLAVGLVAVTVACFSSALAGVYFEKVLKKATKNKDGTAKAPVSMWMRNVQLAFFSIVIALAQGLYDKQQHPEQAKPLLHGFTVWVWVLVALQAGGGLLVAAVIKYADNVLKGLATGVSVVVATAFSAVMFGVALTGQFTVGATMILGSVYIFSNELPQCCRPKAAAAATSDLAGDLAIPILPPATPKK